MKKQIPFLFIFSFLIAWNGLSAQPDFAPVGAKWSHDYWILFSINRYYTYESVKDTLLDGKDAHVVELREISVFGALLNPEADVIFASDEDRVYTWIRDSFYMLYDFSAQVGDTLTIAINPAAPFYSGGEIDDNLEPFFKTVVDSVFTVNINNEELRAYTVKLGYENNSNYQEWGFGYQQGGDMIVEKIGYTGVGGPLGNTLIVITAGYPGKVRCYSDSFLSYPEDLSHCNPLAAVSSISESDLFQIFPNPTSDYLNIQVSQNLILSELRFQVTNLQGQVVQSFIPDEYEIALDVANWPRGIYFLQYRDQEKGYRALRFLVI